MLFDRSTSPVMLTDAGYAYMEAVRKIHRADKDLVDVLKTFSSNTQKNFTIGASTYFCTYITLLYCHVLRCIPEC